MVLILPYTLYALFLHSLAFFWCPVLWFYPGTRRKMFVPEIAVLPAHGSLLQSQFPCHVQSFPAALVCSHQECWADSMATQLCCLRHTHWPPIPWDSAPVLLLWDAEQAQGQPACLGPSLALAQGTNPQAVPTCRDTSTACSEPTSPA